MQNELNRLILGDCLEIMKGLPSESVDLIYLDPPFFSNRNYEVIWGDEGEIRSFKDRWAGGIEHYIAWLKERVIEMHRLLKPTGSIFLHCDWHADAYIRVDILDRIFGKNNFRNHIVWKRTRAHKSNKKNMAKNSDSVLYYSKSNKFLYKEQFVGLSEDYIKKSYIYDDNDGRGRYMSSPLQDPHISKYHYQYKDFKTPKRGWLCTLETLQKLDEENKLVVSKNKNVRKKTYLNESRGVSIDNIWTDIADCQGSERIGYPTQKPEALMERIIECASNKGDIILDPFVGGGTTVVVAERLKRKWIGIDQSDVAIKVTTERINNLSKRYEKVS